MRKVVLNVPDEMYSFFIELVQKLGLEKEEEEENIEVPEWQKRTVMGRIESTLPNEYKTWEEIDNQLKDSK